jgi:CDP-diacylglycerol--glycerol-3-phosphate 3-phosphatidyltransferase
VSRGLVALVVVLGAALVSMGAYALLGGRRDPDADRKGSRFLLGAGDFLVHWLMWVLAPAERLFLAMGLRPDAFNFAGLAFGLAGGLLIAGGRLELGGAAVAMGGVCDILDGRLARALKLDSAYGRFIDSTLDRFVEVFALLGFVVYLRPLPGGPFAAAAALAGSLLVSYARARGESVGVVCKEGLMQRGERLVLTVLVCLADGPLTAGLDVAAGTAAFWVLAAIAVGTFATAAQRTWWIARRLRAGDREGSG